MGALPSALPTLCLPSADHTEPGPALEEAVRGHARKESGGTVNRLLQHALQLEGKVKSGSLRKEMVESEEFGDVVSEAVEAAARTSDDEKIRQYAAILVGSASPQAPVDLELAAVFRALAELTPRPLSKPMACFGYMTAGTTGPQARPNLRIGDSQ